MADEAFQKQRTFSKEEKAEFLEYLALTQEGATPNGSDEAKRAHTIAIAIARHIDGLKPRTIRGLKQFLRYAADNPADAYEIVNGE